MNSDILAQTITLGGLMSVFLAIIAWQNYKLNKKKADKDDSKELKKEQEEKEQIAVTLTAMSKDIQYIRLKVDKFEEHDIDHEKRITTLENKCKSFAGGNKK